MNGILDDFKMLFVQPNNGLIQIILINIIVFLLINVLRLVFNWGLAATITGTWWTIFFGPPTFLLSG
jgi:hypothetical protein